MILQSITLTNMRLFWRTAEWSVEAQKVNQDHHSQRAGEVTYINPSLASMGQSQAEPVQVQIIPKLRVDVLPFSSGVGKWLCSSC
jgi:hypothetical protein